MAAATAPALAELVQSDFASGMWRGIAPHLIPQDGVTDLINGLILDDGSASERGGVAYATGNALGSSGLTWVWDGYLAPGHRTLVGSLEGFAALSADGGSLVDIGGVGVPRPVSSAVIDGTLYLPGGITYAGSRLSSDYSTGTVKVVKGSDQVHGTGTSWNANADSGMLLRVGTGKRYYAVKSVDSDHTLTLFSPYAGDSADTQSYVLSRFGIAPKLSDAYGAVAERLVAAVGNRVWFSQSKDSAGLLHPDVFTVHIDDGSTDGVDSPNFHELPDGVRVLGVANLRGTALYFTSGGVFAAFNMAADLIDPLGNVQERLEKINEDLVLWGASGIATWRGDLIVPARDGIYLFATDSAPQLISASIGGVIPGYVRAGFRPGGAAVFNSHYFLPILDLEGNPVDHLVCRLDRPVTRRGARVWPWSRLLGMAGGVTGVASGGARLYGASRAAGSRLLDLSGMFDPGPARATDADGGLKTMVVESRAFDVGGDRQSSFVKRLRVRAEGEDGLDLQAVFTDGSMTAQSGGVWGDLWGSFTWGGKPFPEFTVLEEVGAGDPAGLDPWAFRVGSRTRFARVRVGSTGPNARFVLRSLGLQIRPSGKDR